MACGSGKIGRYQTWIFRHSVTSVVKIALPVTDMARSERLALGLSPSHAAQSGTSPIQHTLAYR